jgi:glutathione peroxidase-family protein/ubiquinone/menaquinone biosynthesis C-methylase UbiE
MRFHYLLLPLFATFAPMAPGSPTPNLAVEAIDGARTALSSYAGDVLLVVNVASECGHTPQYKGLQRIYEKYQEQGLRVLAFPSNDFGAQEPGTNAEIKEFCQTKYQTTFDLFAKIPVKGDDAAPFYKFLTEEKTNPRFFGAVKWNFEKFLIGRDGEVVNRFRSDIEPDDPDFIAAIEWALLDDAARTAALAAKKGPPPLREYRGRTIAQTMHWQGAPWLLRALRENEEKTSIMLKELGLKPGMNVADIGSGNGFHTLQMAKAIAPDGTAYAVDIQPEMLKMLLGRAAEESVTNVKTIENTFWNAMLPENTIDLALLADVYHEFSHPEEMLASIRKSLRPGGRLVLVEFRTEDPDVPIKELHKMSKEQILREVPPNGFKLVQSFDGLPWQHLMFFESTGDAPTDTTTTQPAP